MRIVTLVLGLCLLAATSHAATYVVAPTGSDANPCTAAAPCLTPQRGADVTTQPGDHLELAAGTYSGSLRLTASGTAQRPIVVRGAAGTRPILRGGIALRPAQPPAGIVAYVHLIGLELTGSGGISIQNGHEILIQGTYIHHQPDQGISGNGYRLTIDGNVIEHCGPFGGDPADANLYHGMYVGGSQHVVTNNIWRGNLAYGVQMDGFAFDPAHQPGPEYAGAADWLIAYNVFAEHPNAYGLVAWKSGATRTRIVNNIFYANGGGVQFQKSGGDNRVTRNLFYQGSAPDIADTQGGASYTAQHNLSGVDPLFTNAAGGDYHLGPTSPARDVGIPLLRARHDAAGVDRPQGPGVDLGAYEIVVGTPPRPPPVGATICRGSIVAIPGPLELVCMPQEGRR
jgi:hypothetical protein